MSISDEIMLELEPAMVDAGMALTPDEAYSMKSIIEWAIYSQDTGRSDLSDWMAPSDCNDNKDDICPK